MVSTRGLLKRWKPPMIKTTRMAQEFLSMTSKHVLVSVFRLKMAVRFCRISASLSRSWAKVSSNWQAFKMDSIETLLKAGSRYQGIAIVFLNTSKRSSGTWGKNSFMSRPPWRVSVSRTRTMFFSYWTAQRSSWAHHSDSKMPSVMKNMKALLLMTPSLKVPVKSPFMSTSRSIKHLIPGRACCKNICSEITASCALRCRWDRKTS
mmetsp:Transcript_38004/g.80476  ORF Transcript_38004/g.80476 Transcript_38004/m.80476 type:complete len:206 (+) Transcript_38004:1510-2127(+)